MQLGYNWFVLPPTASQGLICAPQRIDTNVYVELQEAASDIAGNVQPETKKRYKS